MHEKSERERKEHHHQYGPHALGNGNDELPNSPSPPPGPPGQPKRPNHHSTMSTNSTWLRGGYATDDDGVVELTTIFPGFYAGRTTHIHLMVRTDWEQADNGTLVSHAGMLHHVGQMFFPETWNDRVLSTSPYTLNNHPRTKNSEDRLFRAAIVDKNSALVQLEYIEDDVSGGLIGFVSK